MFAVSLSAGCNEGNFTSGQNTVKEVDTTPILDTPPVSVTPRTNDLKAETLEDKISGIGVQDFSEDIGRQAGEEPEITASKVLIEEQALCYDRKVVGIKILFINGSKYLTSAKEVTQSITKETGIDFILYSHSFFEDTRAQGKERRVFMHGGSTSLYLQEGKDVSCLLYTSPSPRDKRQSRMPSSA